ncbi:SGNH/GDSL hydrolase family protein [Dorea sp. D27]|uniref:SGNH/GDSL hydrolase family protein n=1 Tax=Dorea sp. D27 TaxID=658665 RepID=UPI00067362D1|nr:SGNH/GDSL hydrolase family protein [Dorea sp. D27]KMZ54387.1 putative lipase/acylhydrolase [Dorea sp. D27]
MLQIKAAFTKVTASVMIAVSLAACCVVQLCAKQPGEIRYLAVGDSIPNGYSCDDTEISPYPEVVRAQYARDKGVPVELVNIAQNGISTVRFNASKLGEEEVLEHIRKADVITVTIGANDLIDAFKMACQDVLGREERFWNISDAMEMLNAEMKAHPTTVLKAIGAIAGWDYDAFEESYCTMMDGITGEAEESALIVVTDIYNPTTGLGMPGTLGMVVDSIIDKMNSIIAAHADEYGYHTVDLDEAGISSHVQKDGLHPTQEGQQIIADVVLQELAVMEQEEEGTPRSGSACESGDQSGRMWNYMAVAGIGVTGTILIILGVWKGKKREKEDEDTTGCN